MTLSYFAGSRLTTATFDTLFGMLPRTFTKVSAQTYTSTTTFQNDADLTCSLEASSSYEVVFNLALVGTDGDIKTIWSLPTDATGDKKCIGPALSSTDRTDTTVRTGTHQFSTVVTYGVNSSTNAAYARETGLIVTTTAGTLTLQHAQNSSTVNLSGMAASSWMMIRKVS